MINARDPSWREASHLLTAGRGASDNLAETFERRNLREIRSSRCLIHISLAFCHQPEQRWRRLLGRRGPLFLFGRPRDRGQSALSENELHEGGRSCPQLLPSLRRFLKSRLVEIWSELKPFQRWLRCRKVRAFRLFACWSRRALKAWQPVKSRTNLKFRPHTFPSISKSCSAPGF